jgi:integrase
MPAIAITKRTVDTVKATNRDYFLWDDEVPGFGLKVTPAGGRIYVFQYRMPSPGKARAMPTRRLTLGKHGELTPDQARREAKRLAAQVTQGTDPRQSSIDAVAARAEVQRQAEEKSRVETELAFENVAGRWLDEYEVGRRPRSYGQAKLVINKHLMPKLAGKPLPSVTRADLQAILDSIPARQQASRRTVYAYASIFFGWAHGRGDIDDNPLSAMTKPKTVQARDRVLADDELATIWHATGQLRAPFGEFYRVLLLTGQRREEVAGMDWAELDRASATWIIPGNRTKNGVAHIVPLAPTVLDELDRLSLMRQEKAADDAPDAKRWPKGGPVMSIRGGVSLSCFSQAKRKLDDAIVEVRKNAGPIGHWRIHDLRRTLATGFQRLGIRFEVTEAVLNHLSGSKGGVAGIYQRHDWADEKRTALETWARHVAAVVKAEKKTNVVPIRASN